MGPAPFLVLRADDGIRTRDPHLGKVMLYQLSHVRATAAGAVVHVNSSRRLPGSRTPRGTAAARPGAPTQTGAMTVPDPRWPSAADWLAAGPVPEERPDLALLGVPTFATSISPTGAHATPGAVRAALRHLSTWSARRRLDLAEQLAAADLGDVVDP